MLCTDVVVAVANIRHGPALERFRGALAALPWLAFPLAELLGFGRVVPDAAADRDCGCWQGRDGSRGLIIMDLTAHPAL